MYGIQCLNMNSTIFQVLRLSPSSSNPFYRILTTNPVKRFFSKLKTFSEIKFILCRHSCARLLFFRQNMTIRALVQINPYATQIFLISGSNKQAHRYTSCLAPTWFCPPNDPTVKFSYSERQR